MKKRIGLIGYGRIGSYLLKKIREDDELDMDFIYEIDAEKTKRIEDSILLKDDRDLGAKNVDLVVEAEDFRAVRSFAHEVLKKNDMLILSVAALADEKLSDELRTICEESRMRMHIPHGALLGMDGLQDARVTLGEVSIVTRCARAQF